MKLECQIREQSWKSGLCLLVYAIALILMIKVLFGVIGFTANSQEDMIQEIEMLNE